MFIRTIKGKTKHYVAIVEAYRDQSGKPKQRMVQNLGAFQNEKQKEKLYRLGHNLVQSREGKELFSAEDVQEIKRENWGTAEIINALFARFKLDDVITQLLENRKLTYDFVASLKFLVADRFISPSSKLKAFEKKDQHTGFNILSLQHLYRTLDELHRYQEPLSSHLFNVQKRLSKGKIDVVFFDVTTLYFESKKQDALRDFGYSKDCKFGEVQVMMSLLINRDGRPIGYELFPGNSYEGHTLLPCLQKLKKKYAINNVVIVADRGLSAFNNLQEIRGHGFDYIIASRLGSFSVKKKNTVLDGEGYETLYDDGNILKYKLLPDTRSSRQNDGTHTLEDQLLCLYSSKRARKDQADRERLVMRAKDMLSAGSYKDKRGAKKYIVQKEACEATLHETKIQQDARFDGYYTLSYSKQDLTPIEVVEAYRTLWSIEASFRTMKHFFEVRPMFHWTPKRIEGHVMLNFIALVLEYDLKLRLDEQLTPLTQTSIREAMRGLERSVIQIGGTTVISNAPLSEHQRSLLSALNIKPPQNQSIHKM